MNRPSRINWLVVTVVTAVILVLTACGGSSHELVYRVAGTAAEAKVAYTDVDGNTREETVTLPWKTSIDFSQELEFELGVSNNQPTGTVMCQVWLDDSKLGDRTSAGYAVCTGSVHPGPGNPSSFISYSAESDIGDARRFMDEDEWEKALGMIENAIDLAPNFADLYFTQGLVYEGMEEPAQALAAYDQAIVLNPELLDAYDNRGKIYGNMGKLEQAVADFSAAIKLDPEYMVGYYNRGITYTNMGEFELAVADFTSVIELDPEYAKGYYSRGVAYANMGELEAARADLLKVQDLTDDPKLLAWTEQALAQIDDAD